MKRIPNKSRRVSRAKRAPHARVSLGPSSGRHMTKPDYKNLYRWSDPFSKRWMRLGTHDADWLSLEKVMELVRGDLQLKEPLKLRYKMGGQPADVMRSTLVSVFVISDRLKRLMESCEFTGWCTYNVEVKDKEGRLLPGYSGFCIKGHAGDRDLARAEVIEKPPKAADGIPHEVYKGYFFRDDVWDGKDFCMVGYAGMKVVTERVVKAFKKAKIFNVKFTPLTEVEEDVSLYDDEIPGGSTLKSRLSV